MERKIRVVARRNMYIAVAVIAIIVVAGVGIALYVSTPTGGIKNPGKIIVDTAGDPQYLDPAIDYETAGGDVLQNCYETLLFYKLDSASQLVPVLCTDWNVSTNGLTYTFVLRHNVTFHDGSPFNASVMKWSLDRAVLMNNPDGPAWILNQLIRGGTTYTKSNMSTRTQVYEAALAYLAAGGVEYVDQYTLKIHVNYNDNGGAMGNLTFPAMPYGGTPYCIAYTVGSAVSYNFFDKNAGGKTADTSTDLETMSVAQYNHTYHSGADPATLRYDQGRGVAPNADNEYMNEHICGTGPYTLTEWTHATRIVMDAYSGYWGTAPKTSEVIINDITDFNSRKLRILSGDSDLTYWGAAYADQLIDLNTRTVLPAYASTINATVDLPTFTVDHIQFNEKKYLPSGVTGVINCANVNGTMSNATYTYHTTDGLVINASLNPFYYKDFREACALAYNYTAYITSMHGFVERLNGFIPAGMVCYSGPSDGVPVVTQDMAAAGVLFAKVNWTGTINYYYNTGNNARAQSALIFHDYIHTASGNRVTINVNPVTWPQFLGLMQARLCPVAHVGWAPDYADPDDYAIPYATTTGTFTHEIWFTNSTVDSQVVAGATSTNTTTRTAIYKDVTLTLNKNFVYLWVGQGLTFHVQRAWVHGWFFNQMFSGFIYSYLSKS